MRPQAAASAVAEWQGCTWRPPLLRRGNASQGPAHLLRAHLAQRVAAEGGEGAVGADAWLVHRHHGRVQDAVGGRACAHGCGLGGVRVLAGRRRRGALAGWSGGPASVGQALRAGVVTERV